MERKIQALIIGNTYYQRKGTGYNFDRATEDKSNLCYAVNIGGCKSIYGDWTGYTKRQDQKPPHYRMDFKDGSYTTVDKMQVLKVMY